MTAEAAGAVPDDVIEEVAQAIRESWRIGGRFSDQARAVLSVPAIADAFYAADEGEVYVTALGLACSDGWADGDGAMASYIEDARTQLANSGDDSDIMPGSEFDGPVIL